MSEVLLMMIFQASIYIMFQLTEIIEPKFRFRQPTYWWPTFMLVLIISFGLSALFYGTVVTYKNHQGIIAMPYESYIANCLFLYFFFSFGNYWIHRYKHSLPALWHYVHRLHHAPCNMRTLVTFFRHPVEILLNLVYVYLVFFVMFDATVSMAIGVLILEGILECFHHSNIAIPQKLRWIQYIIQTPQMHLIHHQIGKHQGNYSPLSIWDMLFDTAKFDPSNKRIDVGFKQRNLILFFLWRDHNERYRSEST